MSATSMSNEVDVEYVNVVGLACDIIGAVWLAWGPGGT